MSFKSSTQSSSKPELEFTELKLRSSNPNNSGTTELLVAEFRTYLGSTLKIPSGYDPSTLETIFKLAGIKHA